MVDVRVLILNGSPRRGGTTASLLGAIRDGIPAPHETEWFDVHALDVAPCRGCLRCRPDRPCALPEDDGHRIGRAIQGADALVVGTPTYWGNMSAPLKAVLDRNVTTFERVGPPGSGLPRPRQRGKRAAIAVSCAAPPPFHRLGTAGGGAVRSVRTVLRAGGYSVVGTLVVGGAGRPRGELPPSALRSAGRIAHRLVGA